MAKQRGYLSEDSIERCLNHLFATGKIHRYKRTKRQSPLDKKGIDFIFSLNGNCLPKGIENRVCFMDVKSSPLHQKYKGTNREVLVFIANRFNTTATESQRLLEASIHHLKMLHSP